MNKYILAWISLFSLFLLVNNQTYRPMKKKNINFGEDVCRYEDISNSEGITYVRPCEEGKRCVSLGISNYNIYTCVAYDGVYDNSGKTCATEKSINGIDCTNLQCGEDKCGGIPTGSCKDGEVHDYLDSNKCVSDPGICESYKDDLSLDKSYSAGKYKKCVRKELQTKDSGKTYSTKTLYSNYIASIDDGEFIENSSSNLKYCKSGYALFFFGNKELKYPNSDQNNNKMYLMCVTVEGKDANGIIKYKIKDGDSKYYDPSKLNDYYYETTNQYGPSSYVYYSLYDNDEFLMTRLEMFKKYRDTLDGLDDCKGGQCENDELAKWKYFYENPEEYLLYKDEPQIIEYLIKEEEGNYYYKVKHTSSNSNILNMKYMLALLSLLLLF